MPEIDKKFEDVILLELDTYKDLRGELTTFSINSNLLFRVHQINTSLNPHKFTLRGLHYQEGLYAQAKLITVPLGRVWDIVVDIRKGSPTYLQFDYFYLDSSKALYIPKHYAHGFLTITDNVIMNYYIDFPYHAPAGRGIRWNDPKLDLQYIFQTPKLISEQDQNWPLL